MCFASLLFSLHKYSSTSSGGATYQALRCFRGFSESPSVLESSLDLQVPPVRTPCIVPSIDSNNLKRFPRAPTVTV
jgi:hypothetical protein